jgi:hypothetical protein
MRGIRYTVKVWLSGTLFTPVVYVLLLTIFSGFHFPRDSGLTVTTYIVPYTFLMSIWEALGILAVIQLSTNPGFIKRNLLITGILIPFAAMLVVNSINALQSYGGGYLLGFAYALSTILFILLYQLDLPAAKSQKALSVFIKDSIIYGMTVWLFTFLFSTPVSVLVWIITKDFKPISAIKTAQDILQRYNFQLSPSIAYCITVALVALTTINAGIAENKKKATIFLFAFPVSFPVLFYYLLFSGDIYAHRFLELFSLICPSIIVSGLSIWLIDIIPGSKKED